MTSPIHAVASHDAAWDVTYGKHEWTKPDGDPFCLPMIDGWEGGHEIKCHSAHVWRLHGHEVICTRGRRGCMVKKRHVIDGSRARVLPSDCQQLEPHDERVLERGRHAPVMSASFLGSAGSSTVHSFAKQSLEVLAQLWCQDGVRQRITCHNLVNCSSELCIIVFLKNRRNVSFALSLQGGCLNMHDCLRYFFF